MKPSPNKLLWRFLDAIAPIAWRSKQAKRIYDAAMETERNGQWFGHAVSGNFKVASNRTFIPQLSEPVFGYRSSDAVIETQMRTHIARLREHANRLEGIMGAYGPSAFRSERVAVSAPTHPFDAEEMILSVIRRSDVDELWINGVHFIRDSSRAFIRAEK